LDETVIMYLQNRGMKLSLIVLALITLGYIALGFTGPDATQIEVGFRQAAFLAVVAKLVLSRPKDAASTVLGCILLLLAMALFWPTVHRFGADEEGTVYRVHRFNGSVESLYDECCPEWMPVNTKPEIVGWYP
jgi:hypothetical protein